MKLPQRGRIMAEYIWIDGCNGVRCKSKVRTFPLNSTILHCPESFLRLLRPNANGDPPR